MIWREKKIPLIILAVLLLANTLFFFTYRVQYENRLRDLDARKASAEGRLQQVTNQRLLTEQQIAAYRKAQKQLQAIYDDRWATQQQRLTVLINEVKRLATATQMVPPSYAFDRSERDVKGGVGTVTVTVNFGVHGTYQQVRRLINLLELSDQFVIIDQIGLATAEGDNLTLNLRLKTIFRESQLPPAVANKEM